MNAESNTIVVAQPTNRVSPVRLGREQDAGMALFPPGQLPSTQIPADWNQTDATKPDYIKNKPEIPSEPSDIGAATSAQGAKADSAYQKPAGGIPASDLASGVIPSVPVKAVKRNGTALTPDANGAVNVEVPTVPTLPLSIANGGTGATTAAAARENLGAVNKAGDTMTGSLIVYEGTVSSSSPIGSIMIFRNTIQLWRGLEEGVPDGYLRLPLVNDMVVVMSNIAPGFSLSVQYEVNSLVNYDGALYRCTASHTGAWSDNDFTAATVEDVLALLRAAIAAKYTKPSGGIPASDLASGVIPDISGKLDATKRNLLPYATSSSGVTLALETSEYRAPLGSDGTFPTITDTGIPNASAYYQFGLELAVPSTVPSTITGPSGWTWIDGHGLPDPADLSGGETICISVRLDCTARTFLASVWRVA